MRSDHAKAVLYFRRALKLNPQFLSAWTLMGHEFMEMKNTNAAIQSYRHAIGKQFEFNSTWESELDGNFLWILLKKSSFEY